MTNIVLIDDNTALATEGSEIYSVDLDSGNRTSISGAKRGDGPLSFNVFRGISAVGSRAWVFNRSFDTPMFVDLQSGDRTAIRYETPSINHASSMDHPLISPTRISFAADRKEYWVLDRDALVAVDRETGIHRPVAQDLTTGWGTSDLALDLKHDRIVTTRWLENGLFFISLDGKTQASISTSSEDLDLPLDKASALHIVDSEAWVGESTGRLISVDLDTGVRNLRSGKGVGNGPEFESIGDLIWDGKTYWVMDNNAGRLFSVTSEGHRSIVSGPSEQGKVIGSGELWSIPSTQGGLGLGPNNTLVVTDSHNDIVFLVDPTQNGDRTVISSQTIGRGPPLLLPKGSAYDPNYDRILVLDAGLHAILAVDPQTGDRVIMSR